jgi:hypothetical protein
MVNPRAVSMVQLELAIRERLETNVVETTVEKLECKVQRSYVALKGTVLNTPANSEPGPMLSAKALCFDEGQ